MMTIAEWKAWCGGDIAFSDVWLGLGIWQAMLDDGGASPEAALGALALDVGIMRRVAECAARGVRIPWRYPSATRILQAAPPGLWVDAVRGASLDSPCWRVVNGDDPGTSHQRAWRQPLVGAGDTVVAASNTLDGTAPQLRLGWPLRIGYFDNNKPDAALRGLLAPASRTAGRLTRQFALGRDHAKCDLLVFWGTAPQCAQHVRASNGRIKANLLMLISPDIPKPEAGTALCELVRASGIMVLDHGATGDDVDPALHRFIVEFSHGLSCDAALRLGVEEQVGVAVMRLSEELAGATLHDMAGTLKQQFDALPDNAFMRGGEAVERVLRRAPTTSDAPMSAGAQSEPPGDNSTSMLRKSGVNLDLGGLVFHRESEGATVLADLAESVNDATVPPTVSARRAERFLQQQSFVLPDGDATPARPRVSATHGFLVGKAAEVDLRIGPQEESWQGLPDAFDDADLFLDRDAASLTVWLTEPEQLAAPVSAKLALPRDGASAPCTLRFTPRRLGRFEGRVTVLHHGRVLQTALLTARVIERKGLFPIARPPRLERITPVRHNLGDVRDRRYFDLAIVENHSLAGAPRTVALSPDRAWIADASALIDHLGEISESLTEVAQSAADFADGIEGDAGKRVLIDLARSGSYLHDLLMDEQLERPDNNAFMAGKEFIQIVSMRSETLPLEFVYDFPAPRKDAALCAHWRDAVSAGQCDAGCGGGTRERVCPMGFWSVSKVIERHQLSYEHRADGKEYFLQSEPTRQSDAITVGGPVVFSGSSRIKADALAKVRAALMAVPGVEPVLVRTWEQWASEVAARNPGLILSMPHTDGTGRNVSLEISEQTIESIDLTDDHVCPRPAGRPPIVVLLGCDVAAPTEAFSRHVAVFNRKGAAVVLATVATVASSHAAEVAALLATELLKERAHPFRLGEAIRAVKRQSLLNNLIMPLCVVAYGDADWRIETTGAKHDDVQH
nr:hypothetical protein [uncultured Duganella sp.]